MHTDDKSLANLRRGRLRDWMGEHSIRSGELAVAIGSGRAYASLLFKEGRHFGEKSARNIEQKLRMPDGYLDACGDDPLTVTAWVTPGELPEGVYALVPRVALLFSEEAGKVVSIESRLPPMAFTKAWLQQRDIQGRDALRFCKVVGPAMEPGLRDGDVVMIDTTQKNVVDGREYAIQYGPEIRVRKLFSTLGEGVRLHGSNPGFPDEVVDPASGSFSVLGRVVWRSG